MHLLLRTAAKFLRSITGIICQMQQISPSIVQNPVFYSDKTLAFSDCLHGLDFDLMINNAIYGWERERLCT